MRPRSVLMVTHVVPTPPQAGNELRVLKLLQWLHSQNYSVTLMLRPLDGSPPLDWQIQALKKWVSELYVSQVPRPQFESLDPLTRIEDAFCPREFFLEIRQVCAQLKPTILIAQYVFLSRCLEAAGPETLRVIDCHDVFSSKREKLQAYRFEDPCALSLEQEVSLWKKADLLLAIQEQERQLIAAQVPDRRVITTGVDFTFADYRLRPRAQVLLVGSGNPLNRMGLGEFLNHGWPPFHARNPHMRLRVVGGVGTGHRPVNGVDFLSYLPDLAQEYALATLVINPVRAGTGLKIKSLEAISHGRPLITWPNGVEGIPRVNADGNKFYLVADSWDQFALQMIELIENPGVAQMLAQAASRFTKQALNQDQVYRDLGRELDLFVQGAPCT